MDEQIRQIAERLRGLRDVLELTADDIARDCDISAEEYRLGPKPENSIISGQHAAEDSTALRHITGRTDVWARAQNELLLPDTCRKRNQYRTYQAYKYQSLAAGFINRTADPFIVTVEPKPDSEPIHYNSHTGQEFNLVLEGRMMVSIDGKDLILNEGDSLYFNSKLPHGMKALDGKTVKFLAVIM